MLRAAAGRTRPTVCIFSKHMAQFGYDELGKKAKETGFEGVDLTVRPKGHVLPENAATDMPRAVEAIQKHGLTVPMITTELKSATDAAARPTLSTAAKLKVPYWKPGYLRHDLRSLEEGMMQARAALTGLAELSKEYGVTAGYHNHSGNYFGAAVWDTREAIGKLDSKVIGYYYDPGHATIEGGLAGWEISLAMVLPRLKMVALKDFYWAKNNEGKWRPVWCPMGEGMVDWPKMFAAFKRSGFTGPLTLHVEYHAKDELAAIAKDCEFIKKQVAAAYGAA
jgi:sugar phosphate isomerase/epimerase